MYTIPCTLLYSPVLSAALPHTPASPVNLISVIILFSYSAVGLSIIEPLNKERFDLHLFFLRTFQSNFLSSYTFIFWLQHKPSKPQLS